MAKVYLSQYLVRVHFYTWKFLCFGMEFYSIRGQNYLINRSSGSYYGTRGSEKEVMPRTGFEFRK